MASRRFSRFVLSVFTMILLAFERSSAECYEGNLGVESKKNVLLQSNAEFLLGRKMLHEFDEKSIHTPGKSKPAEIHNSFPESQKEKNQPQAQDVESSSKKHEESKAFLEAADEVANLMRKDYRGMARRTPPINNHVPND